MIIPCIKTIRFDNTKLDSYCIQLFSSEFLAISQLTELSLKNEFLNPPMVELICEGLVEKSINMAKHKQISDKTASAPLKTLV